jgi:hypothetical protein
MTVTCSWSSLPETTYHSSHSAGGRGGAQTRPAHTQAHSARTPHTRRAGRRRVYVHTGIVQFTVLSWYTWDSTLLRLPGTSLSGLKSTKISSPSAGSVLFYRFILINVTVIEEVPGSSGAGEEVAPFCIRFDS